MDKIEKNNDADVLVDALKILESYRFYISELEHALGALIDWDGETWRIHSHHPNDSNCGEYWEKDIEAAKDILERGKKI